MPIRGKILLVSSSIENVLLGTLDKFDKVGMKTNDDSDGYPLGLAYLHSYLENKGHEVSTLFLNNYDFEYAFEKIKQEINDFCPDIVGFQILTQNRVSSYRLMEYIHEKYPRIKIILGGVHATIMYKQLLQKYPYAIAVLGEGEITLSELADKLLAGSEDLSGIPGIAYFANGSVAVTPPRPLIENLDEIPFPKHEIFFKNKRRCGIILTARGCPFSCSFCSLDSITRRRVRKRSLDNVFAEIEWMINEFPQMTDLWIQDDTFFVDNARVIQFCDGIIARRIKLNMICSARFKPISRELVEKIEQANFKRIFFGLESGDNEILKNCHKFITQEDIISAIKLFKNSKINIYPHLIVGLPGETLATINTTAKLVQKIQRIKYVYYQIPYLLTVYPGTEVYELAKTKGMMTEDYWLGNGITPVYTAENTLEQLYNFKEILLDKISANRAFTTWRGFINQYYMIPYHLKYIFSSKDNTKSFIYNILRLYLPQGIFYKIKKAKHFKFKYLIMKKINPALRKIKNIISFNKNYKISYSQCGEDLIIDFIFKAMGMDEPSYLEIGAYNPTKINNTYLFYKKGSSGVCIEPDPYLYEKFKNYRKNDTCLNIGIASREINNADFYIMSSQTLNTFSKQEAERLAAMGSKKIEKVIKVDLKNINWVIDKYFKSCPNLVEIDVEGLDLEILKSLDLKKFRPEVICIETLSYTEDNTEEKESEVSVYMKQNGYMLYADTYINSIFVESEKWKTRKIK